jgi:energy-coupling factor transporter ATP-binding protein EcfA2
MGKRLALLICNNEYLSLPILRTPVNNGEKLKSILTKFGEFSEVLLIKNENCINIKRKISNFLKNTDAEDEILFYYSGHGALSHEFLLTGIDTPKDEPDISSISKSFIFHKINNAAAKQFFILVDSCYSGGMTAFPEYVYANKKIEILTASDAFEYTFESDIDADLYSNFSTSIINILKSAETQTNQLFSAKYLYDIVDKQRTVEKLAPQYKSTTIIDSNSFVIIKNSVDADTNTTENTEQKNTATDTGILYLEWLLREHSYLKLHGIHSAHNFKGVALENIYVALRGEKSSSYEKVKANNLAKHYASYFFENNQEINEDILYELELDYLQETPVLPSILEKDKIPSEYEIPITLGEAFRDERFLIILGDPGSGKTTLAKWLAIQLARNYKEVLETGIQKNIEIPESKVDPYMDLGNVTYDLGPARFPILLSIADYAQTFSEAYPHNEISIIEYIGNHKWRGKNPCYVNGKEVSPIKLKAVFEYFLKKGEAVVILDGMDEVTKNRKEIVFQIQEFISKWIIYKGNEKAAIKMDIDWRNYADPKPGIIGGNQVVITSRIVGYHLYPITNSITHVTIEPMKKKAIGRFCDMWMEELHKTEYKDKFPESNILALAEKQAHQLKQAIFEDRQILELATNPLLITIIALVYHKNHGTLPSHKAALYQEALVTLIKTWRRPDLSMNEVEYVLSAVAQTIHTKYPKGIIKESELISIIEKNLALSRGRDIKEMPANFGEKTVVPFIKEIRNKVGIIAPRGDKVYGFIHLTFQEYLTALYLTRDKYKTIDQIIKYLDNPRWKVPLMMALGHISVDDSWSEELFSEILNAILDSDSKLSEFFPRSTLLLSHTFEEISLKKIEVSVIERVIFNLLKFYHNREQIQSFPKLKRRIEKGFVSIKRSEKGEIVEDIFYQLLTNPAPDQLYLIPVAVTILYENRWFSKRIVTALYKAIHHDSEDWNWIINRTLTQLVSDQLAIPAPVAPERPESPKMKFEREIENYTADLEKLQANELTPEIEHKIEALRATLPVLKIKSQISNAYLMERLWNEEIEECNKILGKILDYSFEEDIRKARRIVDDSIDEIKKTKNNDIEIRRFINLIQSQYINLLDKALHKILTGKTAEEINKKIHTLRGYVQKAKDDTKELFEKLAPLIPHDEFTKFQKDLPKLEFNKNDLYPFSKIEQIEEQIEKTRYLCYLLLHIADYKGSLRRVTNKYTDDYLDKEQQLVQLRQRIENIKKGTERNAILDEIQRIRLKIQQNQLSTLQYKEEWQKYTFTNQYYEDALEKYQEQTIYPFAAYQLEFQNQLDTTLRSFSDYYLFAIFWGGYKNESQIQVWKKYNETAMFLQKSDGERNFIMESNPYNYFGKYGFKDPVYKAAVCLDNNTIKLDDFRILEKKTTLQPNFSKELIYRQPAISAEIIQQKNHLEAINFIIHQSMDTNEIVDATLLKIFTQHTPMDAIDIIASSTYKTEVVNRLKAIQATLEDAVFNSFQLVFNQLDQLSSLLPPEEWFEVYHKLYSVLLKARKSAYPTKSLLEIGPEKYKSILLADHWYTTSTRAQDDVLYEFAVMLDTCAPVGSAERIKNAFLQVSIAPTFQHRNYLDVQKDWMVSHFIATDIFWSYEIPIDVLAAIENYNLFNDERSDLAKGFQEVNLNRLVRTYIPTDDHPQKPELILFCLQNNLFSSGLEDFLPANTRSINYIQNELLPRIVNEKDNFFKCRALIRFLSYARDPEKILVKLFHFFTKIRHPFEKAQVYILLKRKNLYTNSKKMDAIFNKAIAAIQNPLQRIKVILDGYSLLSDTKYVEKFHELVFKSLKQIEDVYQKGRIINLLLKSGVSPEFKNKLRAYARTSNDKTLYNIGLDVSGLNMLLDEKMLAAQKKDPENWTPILLYAALEDIVNFFSPPKKEQSITDVWNNLLETPTEDTIKPLILRGIENGLELIPKAVEVINTLNAKGNSELLTPLYPLLQCTNGNTMLSVEQWMYDPDETLKNYAALYQAEFYNIIHSENIGGLLALRLSSDARTFCRVNIVLSQGITSVKRHIPRKYKLSDLHEISFMEKIIKALKVEDHYSAKRSLIVYLFLDIQLNSSDLIKELLQNPSLDAIFEYASDITQDVEDELAAFISSEDFQADGMLESILNLVINNFCEHIENKQWIYTKIHKSLLENHHEKLKTYTFIPQNVFTLLEAYREAEEKTIDQIQRLVENKKIGLDVIISSGYEKNKDSIENGLLKAVGYHFHKRYIFKSDSDIINIRKLYSDAIFEFFIEWFLQEAKKPKKKKLHLDNTLDLISILLAIWVDEKNISILNSFNTDGSLYTALLEAIKKTKGAGIFACITVLEYVNEHTNEGITLLLQKINSSPNIQMAAIQTLNSIKNIDKNSLHQMLNGILDSDPLSSSIYVSILSNHANDSNTQPDTRKQIVSALIDCLQDVRSKRGIYQFSHNQGTTTSPIKTQYVGRLDEFIFKAILGIVDI